MSIGTGVGANGGEVKNKQTARWYDTYQIRVSVASQGSVEDTYERTREVVIEQAAATLNCERVVFAQNHAMVTIPLPDEGSIKVVDVITKSLWGFCHERKMKPGAHITRGQCEITLSKQERDVVLSFIMRGLAVPSRNKEVLVQEELPTLFRTLTTNLDLRDLWPIRPQATPLTSEEHVRVFFEMVRNPRRELPVCLLLQRSDGGFQFDPALMAQALLGFFHVVTLPTSLRPVLNALRMYNHPLVAGRTMVIYAAWQVKGSCTYGVCTLEEAAHLPQTIDLRFASPGDFRMMVQESVAYAGLRIQCARMNETRKSVRSLSQVERAYWLYKRDNAPDLGARVKFLEQETDILRGQAESARQESLNWLDRCSQLETEGNELEAEVNKQAADLDRLREENRRLTRLLWETRPEVALTAIPIPDSYDPLVAWCRHHLSGKVYLHPHAEQAVKQARYRDVELVYKSLLLLGNEYRDMRLATEKQAKARRQAFTDKVAELHLGYVAVDSAPTRFDGYEVEYPLGSKRKRTLESHLKRGGTFDPTTCLRVYFCWDPDEEVVVVGSLPAHLQNSMT